MTKSRRTNKQLLETRIRDANRQLRDFVASSPFELREVVEITSVSKNDVMNLVRREMIKPDEGKLGHRRYRPLTVASIKLAMALTDMGLSPKSAGNVARTCNGAFLAWYCGGNWKVGQPLPRRDDVDLWDLSAVMSWVERAQDVIAIEIVPKQALAAKIGGGDRVCVVVPIGRFLWELAARAQRLRFQ